MFFSLPISGVHSRGTLKGSNEPPPLYLPITLASVTAPYDITYGCIAWFPYLPSCRSAGGHCPTDCHFPPARATLRLCQIPVSNHCIGSDLPLNANDRTGLLLLTMKQLTPSASVSPTTMRHRASILSSSTCHQLWQRPFPGAASIHPAVTPYALPLSDFLLCVIVAVKK